jgi:hypothetical protein
MMNKKYPLSLLMCLVFFPAFSQATRHDITGYGKSLAVLDARPFPVISEAFGNSLDRIINEQVFLVSEFPGKGMDFNHKMIRKPNGHQFYHNKSRHIGTVRIMPRHIQLQGPDNTSPSIHNQNPLK